MAGFATIAVGVFEIGMSVRSAAAITVGVSAGGVIDVLGETSVRAIVGLELLAEEAARDCFERLAAGSFE
jgi:hypothetical protein